MACSREEEMLKIRDALVLAWTKLAAHRLWTGLFIGLEIILLAAVLLLFAGTHGFEASLATFNSEGLNGRYLVTATNVRANPSLAEDPATWDLAEELYQTAIAERTQLAEEYGVTYSPDAEIAPTEYVDGEREANPASPYLTEAIDQRMQGYLEAGLPELESILQNYPHEQIYRVLSINADGQVTNLVDGQEDLDAYSLSSAEGQEQRLFTGLNIVDATLYQDYLFDDFTVDPEAIPVVVSAEQAAELLGLGGMPGDSAAKVAYLQNLRSQAAGLVVAACYRNSASIQQLYQAEQILSELERNADSEFFTRPSLIYALPTTACAPTTIAEDTRSAAEIEQSERQTAYQQALGEYVAPREQLVKYQIVGVVPTSDLTLSGNDIMSMVQSLGGVSLVTPLIAQDYFDAHQAELGQIYDDIDANLDYFGLAENFIVEFADANTARAFIENESCQLRGGLNGGCATSEHLFYLTAGSNNSLLVEDLSRNLQQILLVTTVVLLVVTTVLMALMVVRSVAGDRKEIAIFRAIGFTRGRILQIYLTYALIMALMIVVGAVILALGVGLALDPWLAGALTEFFQATFATIDPSLTAHLFMPQSLVWLALCGGLTLASLLSALLATTLKNHNQIIDGLRFE